MTESSYRSAHHLGAGALNGVGLGDEFVLVDVTVSPAKATTDTMPSSKATSAAPASSSMTTCADTGVAYRLTGTQEEKIKPMRIVGREIEVQGRFKHADDVMANGTQAGEKLPAEVEIVSFREAPAPAAVSEPAPATPAPAAPPRTSAAPTLPAPSTPAPTAEPKELPHTAGSSGLLALIGVLGLGSGLVLVRRRRVA